MYRAPDPTPEQMATRAEIRKQFPYLIAQDTLPKPMSSHALGAKNIKRLLAQHFPGVKFSTSSDSFAGGNSIDVRWDGYDDAPTSKQVDELIFENFAYGRFDGMTDSDPGDNNPWRREFRALFGGAKFVTAQQRRISDEEKAQRLNEQLELQTAKAAGRKSKGGMRL